MKLFFGIVAGIACLSIGITIGIGVTLGVSYLVSYLRDHQRAKKSPVVDQAAGPVRHDHDCLVKGCRFHKDPVINEKMWLLLAENKRRGVVVTDHDLKEVALNLLIAEIHGHSLMAEEGDASQES